LIEISFPMTVAPIRPPFADRSRSSEARTPSTLGEVPLSLAHIIGVLLHRRWMILGIAILVTGFMTLYVNQLVPIYSSEATVVVEPSRQRVLNVESVVQGLNPDYYTNETEAAVLGSRELARKVVERLDLINNPLFNPRLTQPKLSVINSLLDPVKAGIRILVTAVVNIVTRGSYSEKVEAATSQAAARRAAAQPSPEDERRQLIEDATDVFMDGVTIVPAQRARILTVRFSSPDPELAARAANALADTYILDQLETKASATTKASEFLNQRADELRTRVIESQQKLEEFRRQSGLVEVGGASVYQRQRDDLETQLIQARAKRAEADARYDQVQKLLKTGSDIDTAAAVLDSQLIQRLREQETQVVRKIAELRTKLRPNHPNMALAESELKDLDQKIKDEVNKIVVSLANERDLAAVRENNLTEEIARIQSKLDEQHDAEVTLRALESEVNANNQLYETILARFKQADVQESATPEADARVISRATVPADPFYPKKRFIIVASLVLSTMMGIGLAIVLEFLDTGFRSLTQLDGMAGVPSLGVVPFLRAAQREGKSTHQIAAEQPNSAFGEAIRTLRTSILLSNVDHPPRSVMVTSALPGEGKTSTTLALACLAAKSGQKVVVVDCDFRHPSVHEDLNYPNGSGLADYLVGQASLNDILEIEPRYGLRFITAGTSVPNPPDLLGSPKMRDLIQKLSDMFDLVLFDTPPLLIVSDSLVLARFVDKAVFVVRWVKTKRKSALLGLKQLIDANADVAGVVLSQVDIRRQSQYDSDGYYRYHHYYTN
jgi:polysaccharide biosynthesis transport protein